MDPVQMGKFLARLRREAGLTQEALGQALGVTNKTVSRWENGNYLPDLEMLQLLSARFGVSVDELIGGGRIPAQAAPDTPACAMTNRTASGQTDFVQMKPEQAVPEQTVPKQTVSVRMRAEQTVLPQESIAETTASRFALAERIAYWKRKWLREHLFSLILCYAFLCILLPVLASALELAGNVPFLLGGWSLLTLAFYIAARNRMMIYVETRAFLP